MLHEFEAFLLADGDEEFFELIEDEDERFSADDAERFIDRDFEALILRDGVVAFAEIAAQFVEQVFLRRFGDAPVVDRMEPGILSRELRDDPSVDERGLAGAALAGEEEEGILFEILPEVVDVGLTLGEFPGVLDPERPRPPEFSRSCQFG